MKKKPEKKKSSRLLLISMLAVIVAVTAVRLIFALCGAPLSDTLVRVLGCVEILAVAVLVYSYIKDRQR